MSEGAAHILHGTAASAGVGVGRPFVLKREERYEPSATAAEEKLTAHEVASVLVHWHEIVGQLRGRYDALIGSAESEVVRGMLEAQRMILMDPELQKQVRRAVQEELMPLLSAIHREFAGWAERWASSGAEWVEERVADLLSVRDDLMLTAQGKKREYPLSGQTILFADELAPVEMISMARTSLQGMVLLRAGQTSHAVILAKSLGLPCVVGVDWMGAEPGRHAVALVDGNAGEVWLLADDAALESWEGRENADRRERAGIGDWTDQVKNANGRDLTELREKAGRKSRLEQRELADEAQFSGESLSAEQQQRTRCGEPFALRANIEYLMEMERIRQQGARGVGLLRTESMLMSEGVWSRERQIRFYERVLAKAEGEQVTIRLFDAGGDKGRQEKVSEANPFLGWRGVRMLLDQPDLLKLQLEAILIASASEPGRVSVMIPMVTFLEEIDRVRAVMKSVMDDLDARGVSYDRNIPFGVMMEVPALVLQAKAVAERVDFMSIGTNDLIQYTLAADRGNERVAAHFEPRHPAVWKLVSLLRDASLQTGCSLRVCGEMASEPAYAAAFLGFGVRELSMGVQDVPAVRSHLAEVSIGEAESLAHSLVAADCMKEVHAAFEAWKKNYLL